MVSGKNVLRSIDDELRAVRRTVVSNTSVLARTSRYLADVRHGQADAYRDLARIRLGQIQSQELVERLDASDRHARGLLDRHAKLLSEAEEAVAAEAERIEELERRRESQEQVTDGAQEALESAIESTRSRLEQDPDYQTQSQAVQAAHDVAARAAQKVELALTDRIEKGAPYEADPLFKYLWEREYGTDAYSAFPLFAALDGWVASLCSYRDARRNYRLLIEIPERMREHAQRVAGDAEAAEEALAQLEEEAFVADGHGPVKEHATREEAALEAIDHELEEAEARHLERSQEHSALASGTDPTFREALETVLETLRRRDLRALREEVEHTPLPEDDVLVEKLLELESEQDFLQERVAQESATVETSEKLLSDLEWVRSRFKAAHFDGPHATFKGSDFLPGLVLELSRRAISRDTFWTSLRRRYKSKAPSLTLPTGLPRGRRGSWGGSLSSTLGRIGRTSFPTVRSGSFGGGGFKTAGSFGRSGGFKTGGGF